MWLAHCSSRCVCALACACADNSKIGVRWFVFGLSPGNHTWHVHDFGNIGTANDGLCT